MWELQINRDIPWKDVQTLETYLVQRVQQDRNFRAFLVSEPRPTFTHGLSSTREDLLWPEATLKERGIAVEKAGRGGQWTYHGPGQIVIFPIVHLESLGMGRREVRKFIDQTREALIQLLQKWDIPALAGDKPYGIYVDQKKIASFGFSFERGVVKHGVAIYHSAQNDFLGGIHPCGVPGGRTTSLTELGIQLDWETVARACVDSLKSSFQAHLV